MRRLRRIGALLGACGAVVALWATLAHAVVPIMLDGARQTDGTLGTALTTTGATNTSVCTGVRSGSLGSETCRGGYYQSIVFTYCSTAGTATVGLEVNCAGAGWVPVVNSSKNIAVGCDGVSILYPQCAYRARATACSSCSVTSAYSAGTAVK